MFLFSTLQEGMFLSAIKRQNYSNIFTEPNNYYQQCLIKVSSLFCMYSELLKEIFTQVLQLLEGLSGEHTGHFGKATGASTLVNLLVLPPRAVTAELLDSIGIVS